MLLQRDAGGVLRVQSGAPDALAEFLEQDVGETRQAVDGWLSDLSRRTGTWHGSGNVYRVSVSPGDVSIESLFADPPLTCRLPLEEFRLALRQWLEAVNSP